MHILLPVLSIAVAIVLHFTRCFGHPAVYDAFSRFDPDGLDLSADLPFLRELERLDRNRDDAQNQEQNILERRIVHRTRPDAQSRASRRTKS